jgi:hypothetical protein
MGEETIPARDRKRNEAGSEETLSDEEKKEKPKRRKLITVRIIEYKGKSALVEWQDGDDRQRAFVPLESVEKDKCDEEIIKAGVLYGVPWEEFVDVSGITPEAIGKEMRKRNLWTAKDMERNAASVSKAIAALISPVVISLRRAAREK